VTKRIKKIKTLNLNKVVRQKFQRKELEKESSSIYSEKSDKSSSSKEYNSDDYEKFY
jgi:hypothetical protein